MIYSQAMRNALCSSVMVLGLALVGCDGGGGSAPAGSGTPAAKPAAPAATAGAGEVLATYGGKKLTSDIVMKEMERLPPPSRAYLNAPERKRQFVENIILNDLLFEEGQRESFDKDEEIERQVTDLRKRLVVQRVMRKYQTPPEINDEQAKKYFDDNPTLYSTTQIRASHILVKEEAVAKELHAKVKAAPDSFADVAKEKSTDTMSAQKGGDLGMFGQGRMVAEFEKVAFGLKVNDLSDVVKTQYGYHIIKVTERKDGERKPFDQVKEQIKATLRNKLLQEQTQGHMDQLKKQANLQIIDDAVAKLTPPAAPPGGTPPPAMGH
jgi:peptidyl-prolyl cis-trans isomerase C